MLLYNEKKKKQLILMFFVIFKLKKYNIHPLNLRS